uniref:Uncharacterized protein n=1 Tax=Anopheles epiroticus TaxID=199890 RepID=A0A182PRC4_9DIPT
MGPYPLSDHNLLDPSSKTMDGEMGPYPLSDHSNLLGPTSKYAAVGLGYTVSAAGYGGVPMNYGTTTAGTTVGQTVAISTNCSPMPLRRTRQSGRSTTTTGGGGAHGNATYGYQADGGDGVRDSFRRHSAHGRIVCTGTGF